MWSKIWALQDTQQRVVMRLSCDSSITFCLSLHSFFRASGLSLGQFGVVVRYTSSYDFDALVNRANRACLDLPMILHAVSEDGRGLRCPCLIQFGVRLLPTGP
jgi:hypothetical protein